MTTAQCATIRMLSHALASKSLILVILSVITGLLLGTQCKLAETSSQLNPWTEYDALVTAAETILSSPDTIAINDAALREYISFATVSSDNASQAVSQECATWLSDLLRTRLEMHTSIYESSYKYPIVVGSSAPLDDTTKAKVIVYGKLKSN